MTNYYISILEESKKVFCTTEFDGKIATVTMPDLQTDLPSNVTISARSPIEAIRKYWRELKVDRRPCKLLAEAKRVYDSIYIIDWAGWNENGCGQTGWWVLRNEEEYKQLRDDHGNALFELPDSRLLMVE